MIMQCTICRRFSHDPIQRRDLYVLAYVCIDVVGCIFLVASMAGYWCHSLLKFYSAVQAKCNGETNK